MTEFKTLFSGSGLIAVGHVRLPAKACEVQALKGIIKLERCVGNSKPFALSVVETTMVMLGKVINRISHY